MLMRLSKNSSGYISFSRSTAVEEYHHIHLQSGTKVVDTLV